MHLGAQHLETASVLSILGTTYMNHGQYDEAEEMHQRALAVRLEDLGATFTT